MPASYLMIIWYLATILVIMVNILSLPLLDAFPEEYFKFECSINL